MTGTRRDVWRLRQRLIEEIETLVTRAGLDQESVSLSASSAMYASQGERGAATNYRCDWWEAKRELRDLGLWGRGKKNRVADLVRRVERAA